MGGENTLPSQSGVDQAGARFVKEHFSRWASQLYRGDAVQAPPAKEDAFDATVLKEIQDEVTQWSNANGGWGVKLVVGNTKSGGSHTIQAGKASKGTPVSEKTIFRMGGMTKVMAGMLTAIAFEEGVVKPTDAIANFVPELDAAGLKAVSSQGGVMVTSPLNRNFTFWDCLGMKCGFSYSHWGMGTMREASTISPADGVFPLLTADKCAGAYTTAHGGKLIREAAWLECRKQIPLVSQPGQRSYYGYDYDVIGLALSRAYKMNAEELMRTKIWSKLGMDSAFMSWLPQGTSPSGDVADLRFTAPDASAYASGTTPSNMPAGKDLWASEVKTWDQDMWNLMGPFKHETSTDAKYPGVSGFGEGAMMTFEDYAKFLHVLSNKGVGSNGVRLVKESTWTWFMSPVQEAAEGMSSAPAVCFASATGEMSAQALWKWGFASLTKEAASTEAGGPSPSLAQQDTVAAGQWSGEFGTMFKFDAEAGVYGVGGENTLPGQSGAGRKGIDFIRSNYDRWMGKLARGRHTKPAQTVADVQKSASVVEIQKEVEVWSKSFGRGVKLVIGNAKTGEQQVFSAGDASKGTPVSEKTIFRMGGMTKVMAGMLTAIAFEEGVVKPTDAIAKFVPELDAAGLKAVSSQGGVTVTSPLNRNFTFWDCLGMKCGFSYSHWGMGTMREASTISPSDGVLPFLSSNKCAGAYTTAHGGKLIREAAWLECRKQIPLVSQPGQRSYYGYDYDVIGLALSRAYKMNAEELMRTKIWSKLGMDSAFMSWLPQGTSPSGDVADLRFTAPDASAYASGTTPSNMPAGKDLWASEVQTWDQDMWNLMGPFKHETSTDAKYPGVSGFGEGAMMTFEDYAKFLSALLNNGNTQTEKLLGDAMLRAMAGSTTSEDTGLGATPAVPFVGDEYASTTEWKWGYAHTTTGEGWSGEFGTVFRFNRETGDYLVGGENTLPAQAARHHAKEFILANAQRWTGMLRCDTTNNFVAPNVTNGTEPLTTTEGSGDGTTTGGAANEEGTSSSSGAGAWFLILIVAASTLLLCTAAGIFMLQNIKEQRLHLSDIGNIEDEIMQEDVCNPSSNTDSFF